MCDCRALTPAGHLVTQDMPAAYCSTYALVPYSLYIAVFCKFPIDWCENVLMLSIIVSHACHHTSYAVCGIVDTAVQVRYNTILQKADHTKTMVELITYIMAACVMPVA